jgi:phosphoglycerate dehydrogenase-like enzyme
MPRQQVLILAEVPASCWPHWQREFPDCDFLDGRQAEARARLLPQVAVCYGLPPLAELPQAGALRWLQLISAGVPLELCPLAQQRRWQVTNLAGLYGPSIAEHALGLMTLLARQLHQAMRQQLHHQWDRQLARHMTDLRGKTLLVLGLGNIGQAIARLAQAYGMRVLGWRRRPWPCRWVDVLAVGRAALPDLLAEADFVVVALPLTRHTQGLLGPAEFAALKPGAWYVNVSRGAVAQEEALLEALTSGRLAGAGLDAFAVEPLPADHPFWSLPQVIISPHCSGEVVNASALPAERFTRNLHAWLAGAPLEGQVDLEWGY